MMTIYNNLAYVPKRKEKENNVGRENSLYIN